jgi:hypothetical protein
MFRHKTNPYIVSVFLAWLPGGAALAAESPAGPASRPASSAPRLSQDDQTYLVGVIRGTVAASLAGREGEVKVPADLPPAVAGLRCPVAVTLRRGGLQLGQGQSDGGRDVAAGCQEAVLAALKDKATRERLTDAGAKQAGVEVELLGPAEQIPVDLAASRRLTRHFEPGLDGVAIRVGDRRGLIRPSQIIANGFSVSDAIGFVLSRLGLKMADVEKGTQEAVCMRFRTLHFWQPLPGAAVVQLDRGCVVLGPGSVAVQPLDRAIREASIYLRERQRSDGLLNYAYLPWDDRMEPNGPVIAQAGAIWGLAFQGARMGDEASVQAAVRGVQALVRGLCQPAGWNPRAASEAAGAGKPQSRPAPSAYLSSPDQADRIGATALLLLAVDEIQPAKTYRSLREQLTAGLAGRQLPTGMFQTNFVTTQAVAPQDTDPGQALLALARTYQLDRVPSALTVISNSCDHYRKQFSVSPAPGMVPWLASAYAQIALITGERRYTDFAFEMIDWLERFQLTAETSPSPLMIGGIDPLGFGAAGVSTAEYMAAVADTLQLARKVGDEARSARYERMLRAGTRFVLQLQFRPDECYYVRSRVEVVGGIRSTPWDHTLTIENCQHALIALTKARLALFSK